MSSEMPDQVNTDNATLYCGDCLEILPTLPDNSVDAVVTDPPYGLSFMGKRWDYDVPGVDVWRECLRVLKPGGHLLAFAGTRTQHRMAVNIEDAGFNIRDMIAWVYGSGFPKSHNLKGKWDGWGTALKPAHEPITVARKPFRGSVAQNVAEHGTGALNIDGCRVKGIGAQAGRVRHGGGIVGNASSYELPDYQAPMPDGRWPANLIHDVSEEVLSCFPETAQSVATLHPGTERGSQFGQIVSSARTTGYSDTGSAARFFYCAKASKADREEGLEGDATCRGGAEVFGSGFREGNGTLRMQEVRNHHPTVKPTALMRYLCRLVTPPGGVVLDPFAGSGSTGKCAALEGFRFIGVEREREYFDIACKRIEAAGKQINLFGS